MKSRSLLEIRHNNLQHFEWSEGELVASPEAISAHNWRETRNNLVHHTQLSCKHDIGICRHIACMRHDKLWQMCRLCAVLLSLRSFKAGANEIKGWSIFKFEIR